MNTGGWTDLVWFGLGLLVIALATAALARYAGATLGWLPVTAMIRAGLQLAVIAALLRGIFATPWTVVLFVALMFTTASWTSGGRVGELWHGRRAALIGVLAGAGTSIVVVFALHLVQWQVRYLIAIAGILIGNAMTASTLAGRNFLRGVRAHRDEVEGWLALGATPVHAHRDIAAEAVRETLLPNLDQTRATGLVTLPGAFVGALFGGASPLVAAQFQLVVLVGIGLTTVLTALVVSAMVSRSPFVPSPILPSGKSLPR